MRTRQKPNSRVKLPEPEINITPLVDVVLVLLIIFMVITPALAEGDQITLPMVESADAKSKANNAIDVGLVANGNVLLDKVTITPADLEARLREEHARDPKRPLLLKSDESVPYQRVRDTLALVERIGIRNVSLKVNEKKRD